MNPPPKKKVKNVSRSLCSCGRANTKQIHQSLLHGKFDLLQLVGITQNKCFLVKYIGQTL